MSSDATFNVTQIGAQAEHGTAVAAARVFPTDPGVVFDLDRATTSVDEDWGDADRHHAGRSYHGVRAATTTLNFEGRFEDIMDPLEMHVAGGVTPSAVGDDWSWQYDFDSDTDTLTRYTLEGGTDQVADQWRMGDCLIDEFEYGYEALTAPGAAPWKASATVFGVDREPHALTVGVEVNEALETMLGHHTVLHEGPISEAFGDLDELEVHLAMFSLRSSNGLIRRPYGAADNDRFQAYGRGKAEVGFSAMIRITSTSRTNLYDVWNVEGSLVTERRWRIATSGSGNKAQTIDAQVAFTAVPIGDRDGEHVFSVEGYFVKNATLGSRGRITVVNGIESLPGAGS